MTVTVWQYLEGEPELGVGWEERALARSVDEAIETELRDVAIIQLLSRCFTRHAEQLMAERGVGFADVVADVTDRVLSRENELGRALLAPLFVEDACQRLGITHTYSLLLDTHDNDGGV